METGIFQRIVLLSTATALLAAQDTIVQGTYKGQWTGTTGGGDIHMTFRDAGDGKLTPEVGFTLNGTDVACKVLSFKIDGANFKVVYEFDAQGTPLQSAVEVTVKGKSIEGTYKNNCRGPISG